MPTYVYRCPDGHEKEQQRPIKDRDGIATCEVCHAWMTRQPAAPGVAFRGPGFYATDYAKPRPRPETDRDTTT